MALDDMRQRHAYSLPFNDEWCEDEKRKKQNKWDHITHYFNCSTEEKKKKITEQKRTQSNE